MKAKRILSIILSVVVLLSALSLVSCDTDATPIESINGMSAEEAFEVGFENLDKTASYNVSVDAQLGVKILVVSIPVTVEDLFVTSVNGNDMHYKFTDEDVMFIDNTTLLSMFAGYDREVWYVDGVRYGIDADGNKSADVSLSRPASIADKILDAVTSSNAKPDGCYELDGEEYVQVTVALDEFDVGDVYCKVFMDENNEIEKIQVDGQIYGLDASLVLEFEYDNVEPIEAPEGFENIKAY